MGTSAEPIFNNVLYGSVFFGFPYMGVPNSWMVYVMENSNLKWVRTGGYPHGLETQKYGVWYGHPTIERNVFLHLHSLQKPWGTCRPGVSMAWKPWNLPKKTDEKMGSVPSLPLKENGVHLILSV